MDGNDIEKFAKKLMNYYKNYQPTSLLTHMALFYSDGYSQSPGYSYFQGDHIEILYKS